MNPERVQVNARNPVVMTLLLTEADIPRTPGTWSSELEASTSGFVLMSGILEADLLFRCIALFYGASCKESTHNAIVQNAQDKDHCPKERT